MEVSGAWLARSRLLLDCAALRAFYADDARFNLPETVTCFSRLDVATRTSALRRAVDKGRSGGYATGR